MGGFRGQKQAPQWNKETDILKLIWGSSMPSTTVVARSPSLPSWLSTSPSSTSCLTTLGFLPLRPRSPFSRTAAPLLLRRSPKHSHRECFSYRSNGRTGCVSRTARGPVPSVTTRNYITEVPYNCAYHVLTTCQVHLGHMLVFSSSISKRLMAIGFTPSASPASPDCCCEAAARRLTPAPAKGTTTIQVQDK